MVIRPLRIWGLSGMCGRLSVLGLLHLALAVGSSASERAVLDQARDAMRKAGRHWAREVAVHGGYVWEYSTDFVTRRRGESRNLPLTTNWVQPPGTPTIGMAFVRAYEATGEQLYLDAAMAAAHSLAWGQLKSGGWTYSIEFDPLRNRHLYHHLKSDRSPGGRPLGNTSTFDDNNTQSATRLLMAVDQYVDDPKIDAAVERALGCFLAAQFKGGSWDGAWPQRYPPPTRGYGGYPTFNDNTMSDCVTTMLVAYRQYGKPEYLDSVKRCLEFYLRSQQPAPQSSWAQQYGPASLLLWTEVSDWRAFCSTVSEDGRAERPSPGRRIWGLLSKVSRQTVEDVAQGTEATLHLRYGLVRNLNSILHRPDFYQDDEFAGVETPNAAVALLARDRGDLDRREIVRLNRLLLEAAYPRLVAKAADIPKPAWARRFEPPSITGGESSGNMRLLMNMYIEFGDERYLDAVGKALEWYRRSRIGGKDVWARFYEVGTNRPLYFTRTYELVYSDGDVPLHYSFKSGYGVRRRMEQYDGIRQKGRAYFLEQRDHTRTAEEWQSIAESLAPKVEEIFAAQDDVGRWVKVVPNKEQVRDKKGRIGYVVDESKMLNMMYSRTFNSNMKALVDYITAAQGGPKGRAADKE